MPGAASTNGPPNASWTGPLGCCTAAIPASPPTSYVHTWTTLAVDAGVAQDQIQHDGGWSDALSYYTRGRNQALRATTHSVAAYILSAA